jgi:HEAT repeat protein
LDSRAIDIVLRLARHPLAAVRTEAIYVLGTQASSAQAFPTLIELVADPDDIVRLSAIKAMNRIGPEGKTIDVLIGLLASAPEGEAEAAARALGGALEREEQVRAALLAIRTASASVAEAARLSLRQLDAGRAARLAAREPPRGQPRRTVTKEAGVR